MDSFFCYCTSTDDTYHRQFGRTGKIIIYSNKSLKVLILSTLLTHYLILFNQIFQTYSEPRKEILQDFSDQNHCKHFGLVYHLVFSSLLWIKTINLLHFKECYIKNMKKEIIYLWITLAATSVTTTNQPTPPPPKKNTMRMYLTKIEDCQTILILLISKIVI